jgi:hypothetical protein
MLALQKILNFGVAQFKSADFAKVLALLDRKTLKGKGDFAILRLPYNALRR